MKIEEMEGKIGGFHLRNAETGKLVNARRFIEYIKQFPCVVKWLVEKYAGAPPISNYWTRLQDQSDDEVWAGYYELSVYIALYECLFCTQFNNDWYGDPLIECYCNEFKVVLEEKIYEVNERNEIVGTHWQEVKEKQKANETSDIVSQPF